MNVESININDLPAEDTNKKYADKLSLFMINPKANSFSGKREQVCQ
jgi:hypothetical protein